MAIFYNDLSLDQLHAIGCRNKIRDVIESEPLSPVSATNADPRIEGLVTQPRKGFRELIHPETIYWRRAVSREEARKYDSIEEDDLGDEDDFGNNAYDHVVLYRSLAVDEKIKFHERTGILVVSVRHNRDLVPYIARWWTRPTATG